jgi:DNA mismatch repair ATPase MutS
LKDIPTGSGNASLAIRRLSRAIGALDQRFSAAGLLLQIFTLRDIRTSIRIEKWMHIHKKEMPAWLDTLTYFDALNSMGGFCFNHPDYIFPEIADHYFRMEGKQLGHPLMNRNTCVRNDISILKNPWFLIVTGANMAGKSTYLRTVGINYILACCGMPVWAESLTVFPAALVTSLRTSDDLMKNESYFFAELKRLKMVIDRLESGERLFIILDEILKGTNSIDKQKGSLALMKQLIRLNACGIIATHDLILGSLEKEFPEQIRNYRFEADITNNELTFSYTLRPGIAQNMNACFLMQKMGITVD